MRIYLVSIFILLTSFQLFSQECPQPSELYIDNYSFNSSFASVEAHWYSEMGLGVQHFLLNYKHVDSLEWNNLANLDSTDNSKIIGLLDFNTTYVWRVVAYCSENFQVASEPSQVDTFTTLEYVDCPSVSNTYHDNIIVTEETAFVDVHWDSMLDLGIDHFLIGYRALDETSWNNLSNMDGATTSRTIGGTLEHNTSYEWCVKAYCSENQSYFSDWSVVDTFIIGSFVAQDFTPEVNISLSSLVCEEYTDINFVTTQGLNEPDIQSTNVTTNLGRIDLENLAIGQNVGNATVIAGINDFINNEYTLVVSGVSLANNSVEIDLVLDDEIDFSFSVQNLEGGGIDMSIVSPSDNNSYTSGNSLDLTISDIFINPSPGLLEFSVTVLSESNEDFFKQSDFEIDCETNSLSDYNASKFLYPNPTTSYLNVPLEGMKTISLFDVRGQLISTCSTSSNRIDVSRIGKGLYFVEIQWGENTSVERLIIR